MERKEFHFIKPGWCGVVRDGGMWLWPTPSHLDALNCIERMLCATVDAPAMAVIL